MKYGLLFLLLFWGWWCCIVEAAATGVSEQWATLPQATTTLSITSRQQRQRQRPFSWHQQTTKTSRESPTNVHASWMLLNIRGGETAATLQALLIPQQQQQQQQQQQHHNPKQRGGAIFSKSSSSSASSSSLLSSCTGAKANPAKNNPKSSNKKVLYMTLSIVPIAMIGVAAAIYREQLSSFLDKQRLQEMAVQALQGLRPKDPNNLAQVLQGHVTYAAAMTVWEFLGLSTIPVETAAGMVFGWPAGAVASAAGKLLGASLAYGVGRTRLRHFVQEKLAKTNPTCQLLAENSESHAPFLSAMLMKFSCFPETIKNFGTAAFLPAVTFPWFFLATALHGCMFTMLWTWLGVETSQQLESTTTVENSKGLQLALAGMIFMGFVLSPLSMAWWIQDLRKSAAEKKAATQRQQQSLNQHQKKPWWKLTWRSQSAPK